MEEYRSETDPSKIIILKLWSVVFTIQLSMFLKDPEHAQVWSSMDNDHSGGGRGQRRVTALSLAVYLIVSKVG